MWIWVLSIVLLVLIWGGGYALTLLDVNLPLLVQILASAAVVLLLVGVLLTRRLRAQARARALEREILRQSEQQAANVRPERRAEILELQRQISHGIQALKSTKLGAKHGGGALYALPWYAIIGPPGCGKTTALRHSGLSFPFSDPRGGGAVKGVGGTRNCDWWFTNEAILLDTAGRYATQDDDRDEWFSFLDLLKRYRPKKPLNGLLVAIAVSDLVQANEDQLATYGKKLRTRIDEIMTRLEMVLPVYLVFTKTDLIAGFSEFFGDLRKSERDQIFGATFPLSAAPLSDPGAAFAEEFDRLVSVLHARAIRVLPEERHLEARQRIYQFPLEYKALKNNLEELVRVVFAPNTFQESPLFRGFYFTSGTQEGRPIDRVIGGMARAFGLRVAESASEPREPKSYFVTDLFRKVVFPDQSFAGATEAAVRRRLWLRLSIAAGLTALGAALLIPALFTHGHNQELTEKTEQVALEALAVPWARGIPAKAEIPKLDRLREQMTTLHEWDRGSPPMKYRFFMYVGDELYPPTRDSFVHVMGKNLVNPTQARLREHLEAVGGMPTVAPDQFRKHYDALKLYMMMCDKQHLDVEWAGKQLVSQWGQHTNVPDDLKPPMLPNAAAYVTLMKRDEVPLWKADKALVSRAQTVLLRAPRLERLYEILVRDANQEIAPIHRQDIFYGSVSPYVTSKQDLKIEGAYTKEGWKRVRDLLGAQQARLADEEWVLGQDRDQATGDLHKQIGELRELYFARYTQAWTDFLKDMEVEQPDNATSSLEELQALSEPVWAYQRLIKTLADNVILEMDDPADDKTLVDTVLARGQREVEKKLVQKKLMDASTPEPKKTRPISPVERAFQPLIAFGIPADPSKTDSPTGLGQYQQLLAKLVGVLTDLRDGETVSDTSKLAGEFEQAFRTATALLTTQDGFTRPLLSPFLMRPITGAWSGVVKDAGGAASGLWETTVWNKWQATLANRYPFTNSPKDAKIEDFSEFFRPESGLLWTFYRENLGGSLRRVGEEFRPTRRFQSSMNFVNTFTSNCLQRGIKITSAVFPPQATDPSIQFDINLHSVSPDVAEVHLDIDGAIKVYKNTPEEWLTATWPAKEGKSRGARVRIRGYSGLDERIVRDGDFGLFRLLDAADKVESGTAGGKADGVTTLVATWMLRSQGAFFKLDIRPVRQISAPNTQLFRGYECPRVIATAGN